MPYQCPLWFEHLSMLIDQLRQEGNLLADQVEEAARHDQHDQHHDDAFYEGCKWCDEEREKYG